VSGAFAIRRVRAADVAELERLMADFASETSWPAHGIHPSLLAEIGDIRGWIAEDAAGRAVGFAISVPSLDIGSGRGCTLSDLYVDPSVRRRGVARALFRTVADDARSRGELWMEWAADADNAGAHRFYESMGAAAKPRHRVFGLRLEVWGQG
jgi:GNAT superfamily N-acetyltransferase